MERHGTSATLKAMKISPRLQHAINLASRLHRDQVRRDIERTPYVSHLFSVMLLVSEVTNDEDTLIGALMHDSLEDVPNFTEAMLREEFGEEVLDIVSHVTEPYLPGEEISKQMQWLVRKEAYLKNVSEGGTKSAIISCADKLHNMTSLMDGYKKEGEDFLVHFHGSMKNQLHFYNLVIETLRGKLRSDNVLLMRLESAYREAQELFKNHD
jgi:(p)ppGpp synthase/HD superfamily hydrolase